MELWLIIAIGGGSFLVVVLVIVACACKRKKRSDENLYPVVSFINNPMSKDDVSKLQELESNLGTSKLENHDEPKTGFDKWKNRWSDTINHAKGVDTKA